MPPLQDQRTGADERPDHVQQDDAEIEHDDRCCRESYRTDKIQEQIDTIPGFDFYGWLGVSAPAGVPRAILERLNLEIGKILDDKSFADPLAASGFYSFGSASLEKTAAVVDAEYDVWKRVVDEIGLQPE